jgi:amino acid transporter
MFACTLASINAAARILFSMGRLGILHSRLGRAHPANETPHHSATLSALLVFIGPAVLVGAKLPLLDIFNDLSTVATYGFLVAYALISLAALAYVRSLGKMRVGHVVISAISILFILPAIISAVYPVPAPPFNRLPYFFIGYLALGWIWFAIRRKRSRRLVEGINRDLAEVVARFSEEGAK